MNKILGNSQGFVQLLVAILVVVVGVTGFYLYSSGKLPIILAPITKQTPPATQQTPPAVTLQENPLTKNWKTFESKELGISFKYPEELGKPGISDFKNGYITFGGSLSHLSVQTIETAQAETEEWFKRGQGDVREELKNAISLLETISDGRAINDETKTKIKQNSRFVGGWVESEDVQLIENLYIPNLRIYGLKIIGQGDLGMVDPEMYFTKIYFLKNNKIVKSRFSFFPESSPIYLKIENDKNASFQSLITNQLKTKQFTNDEIGQTLKKNLEIYEAIAQSVKFLN